MISLYSGTPGSGKSYHAAYSMYHGLRFGHNYICNFNINLDNASLTFFSYIKKKLFPDTKKLKYKKLGKFLYVNNLELTPEFLLRYAKENHSMKKESETVVVIDECGLIFNPRIWNNKDRLKWIEFLSLHRHYGFDFILITQSDRLIDRQIRSFIEYDVKHRKINNFKLMGAILGFLCGGTLFGCCTYWYGIREKVDFTFMKYSRRIASIYDTFLLFGEEETSDGTGAADGKGCPLGGVPLTAAAPVAVPDVSHSPQPSGADEELQQS
ncbi:MAG: zonular occludens toxin domain-containing protein [Acetivibrio ethanolgignens]